MSAIVEREFHFNLKGISRKKGRSAVAAAAYQCATSLHDDRHGRTWNYSRKQGTLHSGLIFPTNFKTAGNLSRQNIWNLVEQSDTRKDARTAKEYEIGFGEYLTQKELIDVCDELAQMLAKRRGCHVDYALHAPRRYSDTQNFHAHFLCGTNEIMQDEDGTIRFGEKCKQEKSDRDRKKMGLRRSAAEVKDERVEACAIVNRALEKANAPIRFTPFSFKERGLDFIPCVHLGPEDSRCERRGERTKRGDFNRGVMEHRSRKMELDAQRAALSGEYYQLEMAERAMAEQAEEERQVEIYTRTIFENDMADQATEERQSVLVAREMADELSDLATRTMSARLLAEDDMAAQATAGLVRETRLADTFARTFLENDLLNIEKEEQQARILTCAITEQLREEFGPAIIEATEPMRLTDFVAEHIAKNEPVKVAKVVTPKNEATGKATLSAIEEIRRIAIVALPPLKMIKHLDFVPTYQIKDDLDFEKALTKLKASISNPLLRPYLVSRAGSFTQLLLNPFRSKVIELERKLPDEGAEMKLQSMAKWINALRPCIHAVLGIAAPLNDLLTPKAAMIILLGSEREERFHYYIKERLATFCNLLRGPLQDGIALAESQLPDPAVADYLMVLRHAAGLLSPYIMELQRREPLPTWEEYIVGGHLAFSQDAPELPGDYLLIPPEMAHLGRLIAIEPAAGQDRITPAAQDPTALDPGHGEKTNRRRRRKM